MVTTTTTTKQQQHQFKLESSPAYINFIDTIHTDHTKIKYTQHIQEFLRFREYTDPTKLLKGNNQLLESYIVQYIKAEKERNVSYSTLNSKFSAIKKFYIENDIENLRWHKIRKILGRKIKKNRDRIYTHQEIQKLLEYADHRMRLIILLLASTGMRISALTSLQLHDLLYYKDENIYQFKIYSNDIKEEYITFCTPECSNAIQKYLEYRKSKGETLTEKSWLIRSHFSKLVNQPMNPITIGNEMSALLDKCNIIPVQHKIEKSNRFEIIRKPIMTLHGFRKFFITMCIESKVDAERREMMVGHSLGITSHYYRPTPRQLLDEYMKAVNLLTINEENRLKDKNLHLQNELKEQNQMYVRVEEELQELKNLFRSKGLI